MDLIRRFKNKAWKSGDIAHSTNTCMYSADYIYEDKREENLVVNTAKAFWDHLVYFIMLYTEQQCVRTSLNFPVLIFMVTSGLSYRLLHKIKRSVSRELTWVKQYINQADSP
jgi:hypothetical protein